jgi:hypothetical protein
MDAMVAEVVVEVEEAASVAPAIIVESPTMKQQTRCIPVSSSASQMVIL